MCPPASVEEWGAVSASVSPQPSRKEDEQHARPPVSARRLGIAFALLAVAIASPDGTLLRCLQTGGTPNTLILVWKCILYAVVQGTCGVMQDGSIRRVCGRAITAWPWMLAGSLCMCLEWLATVASLTTSSASALALFYIAPLWAVPMGLVVNSERLHHRTIVAMLVAFAGILYIFAPDVGLVSPGVRVWTPLHDGQHRNESSLAGDVCGLLSGLAFAAWITTCRHASLHQPDAPLALCGPLGTLLVLVPAAVVSFRQGDRLFDVSPRFILLVLVDCASVAGYNVGTMVASRYLPSAELGLYLTLDVVLAPFLVWSVHGEVPSDAVLLGGGLLVAALLAHELLTLVFPAGVAPGAAGAGGRYIELAQIKLRSSDVDIAPLPAECSPLKAEVPAEDDEGWQPGPNERRMLLGREGRVRPRAEREWWGELSGTAYRFGVREASCCAALPLRPN